MFFVSVFLPFSVAFLCICYVWPRQESLFSFFFIKSCLAVGLGFGISSYLFWGHLVFWGRFYPFSMIAELSGLVLWCLLVYSAIQRNKPYLLNFSSNTRYNKFSWWLSSSFGIVIMVAIVNFGLRHLNLPHGRWDAWAIWNMRARFLFRGQQSGEWMNAFLPLDSLPHVDYPLLIPANVARVWSYIGQETFLGPIAIGFLFTFATVGLLVSSLCYLRSYLHGLAAGLVLLGIPSFLLHGASQYADIPVGFYMFATIVLISFQEKFSHSFSPLIVLAGVMTGFAAWTKNEGVLFMISMLVAYIIESFIIKKRNMFWRNLSLFIGGIIPPLLILFYFKIKFAFSNDLFDNQSLTSIIAKLTNIERYVIIGKFFIKTFFQLLNLEIIILPLCPVFFGFYNKRYYPSMYISSLVLFLMLLGYFGIYLLTPHELIWHLRASVTRLFIQLLPSMIFIFFLIIGSPEGPLSLIGNKSRSL